MTSYGTDPVVIQSGFLPVPRQEALCALQRQPELPWPAKLILSRDGTAGLVAEVPQLGPHARSFELAEESLAAARSWLADGPAEPQSQALEDPELEALLSAGPEPWSREDDGGYRLDITHRGVVGRLRLEGCATGALHLIARGAVGLEEPSAVEALAEYALEVNGRLRLTRVSVGSGGGAAVWVVWDLVLPSGLPRERALREGVGAVVAGRALTEESLRALAVPTVADAYLSLRANGRSSGMGRTA